ncbi:MAG: bifunctional diaminohydroxyphosphoribosylaminopyrimidine deaminase/5-amino-6-(5-phosphoribosylamino)uracil reductase RibD [Patescibacteria group bacterium]
MSNSQLKKFMGRAMELARKGIGFTSPNPAVGAALVNKGKIIGEGWHRRAGAEHAEVIALEEARRAGKKMSGATLYVTLEPCCHFGKTPPCVNKIIASGVRKVVIGMKDPHSKVNGGGARALRKAGIKVELLDKKNIFYKKIKMMNQPFIKWATIGLPYVILKAAVSMDGKIAARIGESKWITGVEARKDSRLERSRCDAVLVGAGTVLADNSELAPYGKYCREPLLRVIIDVDLSSASNLKRKIFRDKNVFIACTDKAPVRLRRKLKKAMIEFASFGKNRVSIRKLLEYLAKQKITSVFVEGGAGVNGAFYDAALKDPKIIDKVIFYIAPKIIGGVDSLSVVGGKGVEKLGEVLKLGDIVVESIFTDVKTTAIANYY